ncbi:MAG: hypothetical protein M3Z31_17000 [Pseudomonadota bacterium]|nr:hypothetical protein [Pseudomonadota bacterium]
MSRDIAPTLQTLSKRASAVGAIALAISAIGAWFDPTAFFRSYFIAWLFFVGIGSGSLLEVALHELTGGSWGLVLRAPLEGAMATLPLLSLLVLPLAFGLPHVFSWAQASGGDANPVVGAKSWWLNEPFFLLRGVVILGLWSAFAMLLRKRLMHARVHSAASRNVLPILCVIVYFITVTVAAFDWIASLVPEWYSSAIGLRLGVSQALGAFAFAVPAAILIARAEALPPAARPRDFQDLGNLLLTFAMLWAYIAYTEFLIIWAEDLPHETSWYLPRVQTSWRWLAVLLLILEFALPVFAMLFRRVKTNSTLLAALCLAVVIGQWFDTLWLVAPSLRSAGFAIHWMDVMVTIGLGGVCIAWGALALDRHPHALSLARREALNG